MLYCLVVFVCGTSMAHAAPSVGFSTKVTGNTLTSATTPGGTTQVSGSTFLIYVTDPNQNITVGDNKGNVYTQIGTTFAFGGTPSRVSRWMKQNGTGGAGHTITVTWTSGSADPSVFFVELKGVAAASLDSPASATGLDSATPFTVSTAAPTAQASEIAIAFDGIDQGGIITRAESTGFSLVQEEQNGNAFWTGSVWSKVLSATGTVTPSFTDSLGDGVDRGLVIDTFKASTAATGGRTLRLFQGFKLKIVGGKLKIMQSR